MREASGQERPHPSSESDSGRQLEGQAMRVTLHQLAEQRVGRALRQGQSCPGQVERVVWSGKAGRDAERSFVGVEFARATCVKATARGTKLAPVVWRAVPSIQANANSIAGTAPGPMPMGGRCVMRAVSPSRVIMVALTPCAARLASPGHGLSK